MARSSATLAVPPSGENMIARREAGKLQASPQEGELKPGSKACPGAPFGGFCAPEHRVLHQVAEAAGLNHLGGGPLWRGLNGQREGGAEQRDAAHGGSRKG